MQYTWIFINEVPMLVRKENAQKQFMIETWLDLESTIRELGLDTVKEEEKWRQYIV